MAGLILINKPEGLRSTQCVNLVKKNFKDSKVGHAGTLDSTASGLLVILIGNATRLSNYIMSLEKVYRATIQFGSETDTCDFSGNIIKNYDNDFLTQKMIDDAIFNFLGWRLQQPPEISAIKINGEAAHKLARSGQKLEISKRPVFFRKIKRISDFHDNTADFEITCSKGTYVRSFARDLGKILKTGAFVKSLQRVSIGNLSIKDAITPASEFILKPVDIILENFYCVELSTENQKKFFNGLSVKIADSKIISSGVNSSNLLCVNNQNFIGFGEVIFSKGLLKPLSIIPKC